MFWNFEDIFIYKLCIYINFFVRKYLIFSDLYAVSQVSKKKKCSPTTAVIAAFRVSEIKK